MGLVWFCGGCVWFWVGVVCCFAVWWWVWLGGFDVVGLLDWLGLWCLGLLSLLDLLFGYYEVV